jgi:hypothetical protein
MSENNFTITGRAFAAGFRDIQRTWLWTLTIVPPKIIKVDSNRLMVHCRTATIPGRGTGMIQSNFGGMQQFFSGKPDFPHTFAVNIEENEDMFVRKFLYQWQEAIFAVSDKSPNQGYSSVLSVPTGQKQGLVAQSLELQLYKADGNNTDNKFRFINGVVQNIGDVALSYDDNASVKYDVTFQYDYYDMIKS